jgi:Na+(H+)/acetate symporter ActP
MASSGFSSVKLPASLVDQARQAAQPARRSVASQIEYWATLGKALEHAGLTTADSQALIAREEQASYAARAASPELASLQAHVLALASSGALATRAAAVVQANKARAPSRPRARKAA